MSIAVESISEETGSAGAELCIDPVAGHIGAEVTGLDLGSALTDTQVDIVREALHRY